MTTKTTADMMDLGAAAATLGDIQATLLDVEALLTSLGTLSFIGLPDTPSSYTGYDGYYLQAVDNGDGTGRLEFVAGGTGGSQTFLGLDDAPSTFSGQSLKLVRVNAGETALEFVDPSAGGAVAFTELTDVPTSYAGQAGKMVVVSGTEDGLEFTGVPAVVGGGTLADGDYGDVVVSGTGSVMAVDSGAISNAKMASMAAGTIKGRATGTGSGAPTDMTVATLAGNLAGLVTPSAHEHTGDEVAVDGSAWVGTLGALSAADNTVQAVFDHIDDLTLSSGGGGGAPIEAEYLVAAVSGGLSQERLLKDSDSITWDFTVAGEATGTVPMADEGTTGIVKLAASGDSSSGLAVQGHDARLAAASTTNRGTVQLAADGGTTSLTAVQGNDSRLAQATTSVRGTVTLAADGGTTASTVVQGNDSRLAQATTSVRGTVTLAADGGTTASTVVQATDSRLAQATTSSRGTVTLAADGGTTASTVVQATDSRLKITVLDQAAGNPLATVSSTTLTDLYSFTVPADTFAAGDKLRLELVGTIVQNNGSTQSVRFKLAGTAGTWYESAANFSNSSIPQGFKMVVDLDYKTASAQNLFGSFLASTYGAAATGYGYLSSTAAVGAFYNAPAESATASMTLTVQTKFDGSATSSSINLYSATLTRIAAA